MSDMIAEFDEVALEAERQRIIGRRKTVAEIAQLMQHSERNVYKHIQAREIPCIKVGTVLYCDPETYAEYRARPRLKPASEPLPPPRPVGRPRKSLSK